MLPWDADELRVKSDSRWRAEYRLLQSWYRETRLGLDHGHVPRRKQPVGSMLSHNAVRTTPPANFLNREIYAYVQERVPLIKAEGGTLGVDRLYRNLLSSQPVCFNLFGYLRGHNGALRDVMSRLLDLDIAEIDTVRVEWAPPREDHLEDRTAFDAYVRYRTSSGLTGFLGIETKYTEKFSPEKYDRTSYREWTSKPTSGFRDGAAGRLMGSLTNQLWRNALLTLSLAGTAEFDEGYCVVVHCERDAELERAIDVFHAERLKPGSLVRTISYEAIIDELRNHPEVSEWAQAFAERYLDLTPVVAATRNWRSRT